MTETEEDHMPNRAVSITMPAGPYFHILK